MSSTLSIRLSDEARERLSSVAAQRGIGVSTLVRDLAEAEARRISSERTRAEGERFMAAVRDDPQLAAELDSLGTPQADFPDSESSWSVP